MIDADLKPVHRDGYPLTLGGGLAYTPEGELVWVEGPPVYAPADSPLHGKTLRERRKGMITRKMRECCKQGEL